MTAGLSPEGGDSAVDGGRVGAGAGAGRRPRFDRHQRQMIGIHFGLGFLLLAFLALVLGQPQLLAAAFEVFGALRLDGRIDSCRKTLDGDARIQAIGIGARLGFV